MPPIRQANRTERCDTASLAPAPDLRDAGAMILPRFAITADQIDATLAEFYACVRTHPGLGPVFARHVTDWPAHEAKIARFWRNAILYERAYDGNPMAVHMAAGDVRAPMFAVWLGLFDSVLHRTLPPDTAAAWSALAHRIGRGMQIAVQDRDSAGPPHLA